MTLASEMERLSQEISDLKKSRRKEVEDLSRDNKNMLTDFNQKRKKMAKDLKEEMAREKQGRKKAVEQMLKDFSHEHRRMAEELEEKNKKLQETLSQGEKDRLEDYSKMMDGIQRFVDTELKTMKEQLRKDEGKRKEEVHHFLDELQDDRKKMAQYWKSIGTLKKEIKREKLPRFEEKYETETVPEFQKEEGEFESEKPLAERVLDYINAHPEGVKVSDMEIPLGVIRIRLGVVAKELLEDGKVKKESGQYFPI